MRFHWLGIGPISRRFHDIVHGFHHKYPDDDSRLVMPLAVSIGLAGLIGGGLYFLHRPDVTVPWWTGLLFGDPWYDCLHWSRHFRKPLTGWGRKLRSHHMSHHFADPETNCRRRVHLTALGLNDSRVGPAGARSLAQADLSKLERLSLAGQELGDDSGLELLARACRGCAR